jgi:hypothetical protein
LKVEGLQPGAHAQPDAQRSFGVVSPAIVSLNGAETFPSGAWQHEKSRLRRSKTPE